MAVFRVKKTGNFTVLSNRHLRDKALSLKAKGLFSQILSLPDNWDYSLRGLACINRESVDAIRSAVRELEQAGYIIRWQRRDAKGRLLPTEYFIYEHPVDAADVPRGQNPYGDDPVPGKPISDDPISENPTQLNKELTSKEVLNKEQVKIEEAEKKSDPIDEGSDAPEPVSETVPGERTCQEENRRNTGERQPAVTEYEALLRENIEYDVLLQDDTLDQERVDELLTLMVETVCTRKKRLYIAGGDYPAELVRARFLKLHSGHIRYVCTCMEENTGPVRNIKKYLLAALFNAPGTFGHYYTARVNYDFRETG